MNGREKIILNRVLFCLLGVVLVTVLAVLYRILATDASFEAGVDAAALSQADTPEEMALSIAEPADAYELATLTFGGTCTPASMLGSNSYGTFNQAYQENGADSFFRRMADRFGSDNLTVAGCSAVFSDRQDLTAAEKEPLEWYRAPAEMASVFSCGGIDAVSLECVRAKDYGADGYADTKDALEAQAVKWGDSGKAIYQTLNGGIGAAVYCCRYTEETVLGIVSWIENARQTNDFVAVYITDETDSYTVPDDKRTAYRSFIDAGADLVVGTNGTKLQPAEEWNGGYIAYSLGTLLDGASKYPEKYAALLSVSIKADFGKITEISCELLPCRTYDDEHSWTPELLGEGEEMDAVHAFLRGESNTPQT